MNDSRFLGPTAAGLLGLMALWPFFAWAEGTEALKPDCANHELSLVAKEAGLRHVLDAVGRACGFVVVVDDAIPAKTVTVIVEKAPPEKGIEAILRAADEEDVATGYEKKEGGKTGSYDVSKVYVLRKGSQKAREVEGSLKKLERMRQVARSDERTLELFGRVVDQNGDPVQGAQIEIHITKPRLFGGDAIGIESSHFVTDDKGAFHVSDQGIDYILVDRIEKPGYERPLHLLPGENGIVLPAQHSDEKNPIVFRMRKENPPAFVLKQNAHISIVRPKAMGVYVYDLIAGRFFSEQKVLAEKRWPVYADLTVTASVSEKTKIWTVVVRGDGEGDGLRESSEPVYLADEAGYVPEVTLTIDEAKNQKVKKYFSVRSRDGAVFSGVDVEVWSYGLGKDLVFALKTRTNPRADRNLEYSSEIYIEEMRKLKMGDMRNLIPPAKKTP